MINATVVDKTLLERIADAVPALVALYDVSSGEYLYVNRAITKLLGYTREEVLEGGLAFLTSLAHPEDLAKTMTKNERALNDANEHPRPEDEPIVTFEYRMRHKNGEWHWIQTEGTVFERDADGRVLVVLNVSVDITAHKRVEAQLKRSLKALESALEA